MSLMEIRSPISNIYPHTKTPTSQNTQVQICDNLIRYLKFFSSKKITSDRLTDRYIINNGL